MYVEVLNNINKMWDNVAPALPITFRQPFEATKEAILREIEEVTAKVQAIHGNVDYTAEAKQRQVNATLADYVPRIEAGLEKLTKLTQDLKAQVEKEISPAKPEKVDQGELLNLKSDLRMVLDPLEPRQALSRMAAALEQFLTEDNGLGTWLLGASDWPRLYAESRGLNPEEWELHREKVLAKYATEKQAQARDLLKRLEGASGVAGVIKGLRLYVGARLEALRK